MASLQPPQGPTPADNPYERFLRPPRAKPGYITVGELLAASAEQLPQQSHLATGRHRRPVQGWVCLDARALEGWPCTLRAVTLLAVVVIGVVSTVMLAAQGIPAAGLSVTLALLAGLGFRRVTGASAPPQV